MQERPPSDMRHIKSIKVEGKKPHLSYIDERVKGLIGKRQPLGRSLKDIQIGDTCNRKAKMNDRDLLLYLGLTNDANPLYLQHDYASLTPYKRPIVPSVMLYGMVSSLVSMELPGPGSHIVKA